MSEKTEKTEENEAEKIRKVNEQIDEHIKIFEDPAATFEEKMRFLVGIPKEIQHNLLNKERADRLFGCIPPEMYMRVFDQKHVEYEYARPIVIHILAYVVQCTSPEVHRKFKPVMQSLVDSLSPRICKIQQTSLMHTDAATVVCTWADSRGDGKAVYDLLRHTTAHFNGQKQMLDVGQFLMATNILILRVFFLAPLENPDSFDNRCWPIGILSIVRRLLQEKVEKFTKELRHLMWEVISSMTRIGGITWFNYDKTFAKLVIQMNHVELQMSLHDVDSLDVVGFIRHLRVLELYTNAICDSEMFGEEGMEIIPHTVGDSTRYIMTFWVETYLQKIALPVQLSISIFHFAIFLFCHEELTIAEEKVRKNFGPVMIDTAFSILDEVTEPDLRGEIGQLFADMLERLSEFELLNDRVPVFIMKYLDKVRISEDYDGWKGRVIDCKCCIMDLRGRVDWYSIKSLQEAKEFLPRFTDPEQHELSHLFKIFDVLPRVK
ncbi:hypothetical protein GCK72_008295 [Caenorhabditis remanei]|uniref:Uncharacterized protein n=1 Tax=Caenorhabditis remanei TaxID=31234 RepID=A0A6A5GZD1_CAERE|nr:hypothetical protein GCK72_008295 [Caenorhabditis remanei]KAF1760049.1 hypothetical protein GCK72_008295 [Caenorhabditis remanei]